MPSGEMGLMIMASLNLRGVLVANARPLNKT